MTTASPAAPGTGWTLEQAEDHLLALELFGMRFGLQRMHRLLRALGSPHERFSAVHVVGTNGKSSTVRMAAAVLEAHGVRTGAYVSPHLSSFAERIRIGDADLTPAAFAAAVRRAATAAVAVDRALPEGERVTQFELLTAAAFDELSRRGVEVAVVEAGLGGRHDATGVLRAPVVVLTNVGLEHTRWLGPTVLDIAREKLAVVAGAQTTLILGDVEPAVLAAARATGAEVVRPAPVRSGLPGFQNTNFGLACAAASAALARRAEGGRAPARAAWSRPRNEGARAPARGSVLGGRLDDGLVAAVARRVQVPGRLQVIGERPLTIVDGAHNPSGVDALAAALPRRPFTAVVSILDDKDAAAMLAALKPRCERVVCTAAPTPRALPPATLASLAGQLGLDAEIVPVPHEALARARELAGPDGAVVATGSIYLVADLVSDGRRRASSL